MPELQCSNDRARPAARDGVNLQIGAIVLFTFICYLSIGVPLAVLPTFVHINLGFGTVLAGVAISVQYAATLLSRPLAGRMSDSLGARQTVLIGLGACAASGVLLFAAALLASLPWLSLLVLLASRLALGFGESWVGTGALVWGIGRVGEANTSRVISFNGITSYGGIAIGAPLGVLLAKTAGFAALGALLVALALLGIVLAWRRPGVALSAGERMPYRAVFGKVLPHGVALALGSAGFGAIASFITLFYASRAWDHAALTLTLFGALFIGARLVFGNSIERFGGFRVAIVSLLFEAAGLLTLWLAADPATALIGAGLTGFGFALVFPAIGVEAVRLVPPASRGAALSAYSVFLDLSLGITGPLAGLIVGGFGYAAVFLFAALAAVCGAALTIALSLRAPGGATASVN